MDDTIETGFNFATELDPEERDIPSDDNALLADYLNALLALPPPMKLDFSEAHFANNRTEHGSPRRRQAIKVIDNAMYFESDSDSELLREENEALQLKVARLIAQLNETECRLDSVSAQNRNLKLNVENLQTQLEVSKLITKNATSLLHANTAPTFLIPPGKETVPEPAPVVSRIAAEPLDQRQLPEAPKTGEEQDLPELPFWQEQDLAGPPKLPFWQEPAEPEPAQRLEPAPPETGRQAELPAVEPAVPREAAAPLPVEQSFAPPGTASRETCAPATGDFPPQAKSPPFSPSGAGGEVRIQQAAGAAAKPARKPALPYKPAPGARAASKVIKGPAGNTVPTGEERHLVAKVETPPPAPIDLPKSLTAFRPPPVFPPPAAEPEAKKEQDPHGADTADFGCIEATDVEPAPVPKAVVRKTINNYLEIQAEADSSSSPDAGHGVGGLHTHR